MTGEEKAYLAGILDGEGSISLIKQHNGKRHRLPALTIDSTDEELIDWVVSITGGYKLLKTARERCKPCWTWMYRGYKVIPLLEVIYPYMVISRKKARANLLITEYRNVTPRNGRYTEIQLTQKLALEEKFFNFI